MKRDRYKEEKDFKELTSVNSNEQISTVKKEISNLIPPEIKIIAKNESQKKLINSIKNNEITCPIFLEDCIVLCIKIPSIKNDKYII